MELQTDLTKYGSRVSNPRTTSARLPAQSKRVNLPRNELRLMNQTQESEERRTVGVGNEEGGDGGAPVGDLGDDPAIGELEDLGLGRH